MATMETTNQLTENRKSIALDAASLGRLTRLQEEVVESTADAKKPHEADDAWTLKRASQTAMLKSSFHRCVQEAAVVGLLQGNNNPMKVVSSPPQDLSSSSSSIVPKSASAKQPQQQPQDELSATSHHRAAQVLEAHVQGSHREKARSWKSSLAMLEQLDQQEETRRIWLEHHQEGGCSTHCSGVTSRATSLSPLPSPVVPRWRKRVSSMTKSKLIQCISNEAAQQAFERAWRLENESHHELLVRKGCTCVYCSANPSPYQTQEYQRLQKREVVSPFPSFVDLDDDDLSSIGSASVMDYSSSPSSTIVRNISSHVDDMQHTTTIVQKKVHKIRSRPPRSLTPPQRTSSTTKRWSSMTPFPTSSKHGVAPTTTTTTSSLVPPAPPSWVTPIANRKHINFNKKRPNTRESLATPATTSSPCGVSSFVVLERETINMLKLQSSETPPPTATPTRKSLDGELDEELLLREELVSLGIAEA